MEGVLQNTDEEMTDREGVSCYIVRTMSRTACAIQVQETGATVCIELKTPLDLSRACLISAIHPVPAVIKLGPLKDQVFTDCDILNIVWPQPQKFGPPQRFQRKTRNVTKVIQ